MLKYSFFLAGVLFSGAALASFAPATQSTFNPHNVTVVYKNSAEPALEPQLVVYCGLEDCIDDMES